MKKRVNPCLLILFILSFDAAALPEDKTLPLHLQAGQVDINQKTHEGHYRHNVQLDQGTTHVRAENALTKTNEKNQLERAIAKGSPQKPAHFWTLPAPNKPELHAYADTMTYYPNRNLLELTGHARIVQGHDVFQAPRIFIDVKEQHLISQSNQQEATTILINPSEHHE